MIRKVWFICSIFLIGIIAYGKNKDLKIELAERYNEYVIIRVVPNEKSFLKEEETPKKNISRYYIVKSGDTLSKISKLYNIKVSRLVEINNLENENLISVGQQLILEVDHE